MRLFDHIERTETRARFNGEPRFPFLNNSSSNIEEKVREVLEKWFTNYPDYHKKELKGRLTHNDDYNHLSSFFELLLHELLIRQSCSIEIHPEIKNSTKRPDFLVTQKDGFRYYLEAHVIMGESRELTKARARLYQLCYSLGKSGVLDQYDIGLVLKKWPQKNPPIREIRKFLTARLKKIRNTNNDVKSLNNNLHWLKDGWDLVFYLYDRSKMKNVSRNDTITPIFQIEPVRLVNTHEYLRKAVLDKSRKFKKLRLPYMIAINSMLITLKEDRIIEALFGTESVDVYFKNDKPIKMTPTRKPDGAWTIGADKPRYTNNSAVFVMTGLSPWNIVNSSSLLVINPWSSLDISRCNLKCFPHLFLKDKYMWPMDGVSLREIFDLDDNWPE